jgi:hypothetical protein
MEQVSVFDGETAKLQEAVSGRDLGDRGALGIGVAQGATSEMHSPQPKIAMGSHAQMIVATIAKRARRYTDSGTYLAQVQRLARLGREVVLEARYCSRPPDSAAARRAQCRLKTAWVVEFENVTVRHDLAPPEGSTDHLVMLFRTPARMVSICRRRRLCKYGATSIFSEPPPRRHRSRFDDRQIA